jgi:hypothetical protein
MRLKFVPISVSVLLLAPSAHAAGSKLLRDAAIFHDEHRIELLIHKEVRAEQSDDFQSFKQALDALSKESTSLQRD